MMQIDEIKLAQCSRCQAYVWVCNVNGFRTAVDPTPLVSGAVVIAFLGVGRSVYEVAYRVSKPHHLRWLGGPGTVWEPGNRILVASHGCGASPTDAVPVEMPPQGPRKAPVALGRPSGGLRPPPAPESGSQGRTRPRTRVAYSAPSSSPARLATPRRFKCATCDKLIKENEAHVAIEHFRFTWAVHDYDCTGALQGELDDDDYVDALYDKTREVGYDTAVHLGKQGLIRKPIETVELPE